MQETQEEKDQRHAQIYAQVKRLFQVEDLRGVDVFLAVGRIAQLTDLLECQGCDQPEISMPRWRLLLRLFLAEKLDSQAGLTPTELSQFLQVSKNTVSSLLRGLEEHGLVLRAMDPKDLRLFRIRLTDAGRQLVLDTAPGRINRMSRMLDGLDDGEVQQLSALLHKLRRSLEARFSQAQVESGGR